MSNQKTLFNYDKNFSKILKSSRLLMIDLDGTIIDFEKIDHIIIKELFPSSKAISFIDNLLWAINRLDIFGNGYAGLKLRLRLYSMIAKKDFVESKKEYGNMYSKLAEIEFLVVYKSLLKDILAKGYKIAIITKNVYAKNILNDINDSNISIIVLKKNKKEQFKKLIKENESKVCVIGNNLSDDILNSYRIGSPYIYIGKSKAINFITRGINCFALKLNISGIYKRGIQFKNIKQIKEIFTSSEE